MKRMVSMMLAAMAAVALVVPSVWAGRDDQPSGYQPVYTQPATQAQSSGGIIGYQPINGASYQQIASGQMSPAMQQAPIMPIAGNRRTGYDYTTWQVGNGPYTLGRDDIVHIDARSQPDFTGDFIVGPEGAIQYGILGDVPVLGMTKYEVQQVISKLLERYVRTPVVNVSIVGYNSKAVYMIGEFNRPGKYLMRGDVIKLREAVIAANLPNHRAAMYRTHIVTPGVNGSKIRKINLRKALYKGKLENDIDLYPGEIVVVPASWMSVVGEFFGDLFSPIFSAGRAADSVPGL